MTTEKITIRNLVIGDGRPKICVPLNGRTKEELAAQIRLAAKEPCDLFEWRADYYFSYMGQTDLLDALEALQKLTSKPIIFTLRSESEGGHSQLRRSDALAMLREVIEKASVDFVDIEFFEEDGSVDEAKMEFLVEMAHSYGKKVILSNHDFDKTPDMEAIIKRLAAMEALGADLPKVAYMSQNQEDVYVLLEAARVAGENLLHQPFVAISMGELGKETRVCGGSFGSALTFASPPGQGNSTAPGQLGAAELHRCICEYYK